MIAGCRLNTACCSTEIKILLTPNYTPPIPYFCANHLFVMRKSIGVFALLLTFITGFSQPATLQRPKLVVGIVVDQMRWDYLYRYYDRYGSDGFKRLLNEGFSCENVLINYLPSFTAVGHATIFSGSVPAIDGIAGNDWTDQLTGKWYYCTSDSSV